MADVRFFLSFSIECYVLDAAAGFLKIALKIFFLLDSIMTLKVCNFFDFTTNLAALIILWGGVISCEKEMIWNVEQVCIPTEIVFTTKIVEDIQTKAFREERQGFDGIYVTDDLQVSRFIDEEAEKDPQRGVLFGSGSSFDDLYETKADVESISTFNLVCTTGSAGSESQTWVLSNTGTSTGKYWPSSNPNYHFYASNSALTFNAAGCTVAAANTTDVVVCYKASPTYNASNSLAFTHIFSKLGTVTVNPASGIPSNKLTNISVTMVPKTGGTYNLRTGAWSSVTTGSTTTIASGQGQNAQNIYLVPGSYTISASWKVNGKSYNGSGSVTFSAGQTMDITLNLSGVMVYTVGGVVHTPCNASVTNVNNGTSVRTISCAYDDWNHDSYGGANGWALGSFYHCGDQLGSIYYTVASYGGYNTWRFPTKTDRDNIFSTSRTGSSVNGSAKYLYAHIKMTTSITHCGYSGPYGTIILPDDSSLTVSRSFDWNTSCTGNNQDVTAAQLNEYLSQGAVFYPHSGYNVGGFQFGGMFAFYIFNTATDSSRDNYYAISMYPGESWFASLETTGRWYGYSLRLVRDL